MALWAAGFSGVTSDDSGATWGPRHPLPAHFYPDNFVAPSPMHLIFSGEVSKLVSCNDRLILSSDDGQQGSTVAIERPMLAHEDGRSQEETRLDYLGFEDSEVGRWATSPHAIWTTTDGGSSWTRRPFP